MSHWLNDWRTFTETVLTHSIQYFMGNGALKEIKNANQIAPTAESMGNKAIKWEISLIICTVSTSILFIDDEDLFVFVSFSFFGFDILFFFFSSQSNFVLLYDIHEQQSDRCLKDTYTIYAHSKHQHLSTNKLSTEIDSPIEWLSKINKNE